MSTWTRTVRRRLSSTPLRTMLLRWRHLGLERSDVFLASYPKSGNTWLRHMLVQILTGGEHDFLGGRDVLIPYVGRHGGKQNLRSPDGSRIVKTHEPYRSEYRSALYLVRDARDVLISNYWFQRRQRREEIDFDNFLTQFVAGKTNSYGSWQDHVISWRNSPIWATGQLMLVQYENLRRDPCATMRRICEFLSICTTDRIIESVVAANSLNAMRQREQRNARMARIKRSTGVSFVRRGAVGQWHETLSLDQQAVLHAACGPVLESLGYSVHESLRSLG